MGTTNGAAAKADFDQLAATRRETKELTDAWKRRHELRRGTPEYAAALETEERLAGRIWRRLRADIPPVSRTSTGD
jgi:hypothetical protein